jgi:hypothetical protein
MKMAERIEQLKRSRAIAAQMKPKGAAAARRRAQAERRAEREAEIVAARARLTPEDRLLAATFRCPDDPMGKRRVAHELLAGPGGRRRRQWEIAAIMGVPVGSVSFYMRDPDGTYHDELRARRVDQEPHPDMPFAEWVKRQRRTHGLSQAAFDRKLGWESGTTKRLEARKRWDFAKADEVRRALA